LEAVVPIFRRYGTEAAPAEELAAALQLSVSELNTRYADRSTLVHQVMQADIERQKREHAEVFQQYPTAVERLYALIQLGLRDMTDVAPSFISDLQRYPRTWEMLMDNLNEYSAPQTQQLLNEGIRQRLFRSDINIQLVSKILVEQLNMLINPQIFPPERYNLAEVFRSIFLYYVRGLCTEEGARIAANHFARL